MPYVRKTRRPRKMRVSRRRIIRRRKTYTPSASWSSRKLARINLKGSTSALTGFPERMTVSLPYITTGRVNPGVVAYSDTVFNLNSCFDPDNSGVGHQPRGFDQWALVYGKYRVSRVDVNILCRQRASHGIMVRAITNNQSASLAADFNVGEFVNQVYLGQTASNTPPLQRKLTFYPHKILGKTWAQYCGDPETYGLVTGNPTEVAFFHLLVQQVDQSTAADFEYEIQIVQRVTFFDRVNLAIS